MSIPLKVKNADFSARLSGLMAERSVSRRKLAAAVGVSSTAVSKWQKGAIPKSGELWRLAVFFNVSMDWFMQGTPRQEASIEEMMTTPVAEVPAEKWESVGFTFKELETMVENIISKRILTINTLNDTVAPMTLTELRSRLRKATQQRGSQSQLAKLMGVPPSSVSAWISGTKEPSGSTTLALLSWVEQWERKQKNR